MQTSLYYKHYARTENPCQPEILVEIPVFEEEKPLLLSAKMNAMPEVSEIHRVSDAQAICAVINAAAQIYQGVIPDECWHEPYMPVSELHQELEDVVETG